MTYELAFHAEHGQLLVKEWVERPNHVLATAYAAQRVQQPGPWEGVRLTHSSHLIAALSRAPLAEAA